MQVRRHFIYADIDTGAGFVPAWVPRSARYNPVDARDLIHDSIEHSLTDTGLFADEVAAFGRLMMTRFPIRSGSADDYAKTLGRELAGMISYRSRVNLEPCKSKLAKRSASGHYQQLIEQVANRFASSMEEERPYSHLNNGEWTRESITEFCRSWLTFGHHTMLLHFRTDTTTVETIGWGLFGDDFFKKRVEKDLMLAEEKAKGMGEGSVATVVFDFEEPCSPQVSIKVTGPGASWARYKYINWTHN